MGRTVTDPSEIRHHAKREAQQRKQPATDLAIAPVTVTQRTCLAILGIESRPFRETVHRFGIRHTKLGNLLVVRVADFLEAIDRIGGHATNDTQAPNDGAPVMSVDEMLARVGHARRGGAR